jgi:molybdate/tungstate transport system permease protein
LAALTFIDISGALIGAAISIAVLIVIAVKSKHILATIPLDKLQATATWQATAIPLAIPPLISGALLLNIYGEDSPLGMMAQHAGFRLTQSTIGIVLAQVYVISPFVVLTASAGIEKVDINYENASRILGRGPAMTFLTITIPLAAKEIVAGISLAWIRAIGEFGANVMVAYNPKTISIQLWEYNALGGLKLVMPGVLIVLIFSFVSLAFWFWVTNLRGRRKTSLVSLAEQYHDQD